MSTVRYFRWDDPGAPSLTGEVGSLTNLLRKCLVGVGGVAYGSKASAGWTEEFIGAASNIAVFKNNEADGGSGCCVRVNDNAPGTAGAQESFLNIYGGMTNINTGVLGSPDVYFRKSSALSSVARPWLIVADGRTAWVYAFQIGDSGTYGHHTSLCGMGDLLSPLPAANTNRYFIAGRSLQNSGAGGRCGAFSTTGEGFYAATPDGSGVGAVVYRSFPHENVGYGGASPLIPLSYFGDTLFVKNESVFHVASGVFAGSLRGVLIPYTRLYTHEPGSGIAGSEAVAVTGNPNTSSKDQYRFGVGLDTAGPW